MYIKAFLTIISKFHGILTSFYRPFLEMPDICRKIDGFVTKNRQIIESKILDKSRVQAS